jgi:hypothetical protein
MDSFTNRAVGLFRDGSVLPRVFPRAGVLFSNMNGMAARSVIVFVISNGSFPAPDI